MDSSWNKTGSQKALDQDYESLFSQRMSFVLYANKLKQLAEKARTKFLMRPDVNKWLDQQAKTETEFEIAHNDFMYRSLPNQKPKIDPEQRYVDMLQRYRNYISDMVERTNDEAFKLIPWMFNQMKAKDAELQSNSDRERSRDPLLDKSQSLFDSGHFGSSERRHFVDNINTIGKTLHSQRQNNKPAPDINQMNFEQALAWANETIQASLENGWEDPEHVFTYPNGWTMDLVKTEKDLAREGDIMGHCSEGYCSVVSSGETILYSLRDPKGESHVTLELTPDKDNGGDWDPEYDVIQVHGKGNSEPKAEYKEMVSQFFRHLEAEGNTLWWEGSGQMSGSNGEVEIRDLEDLADWWESYDGESETGPYGLTRREEQSFSIAEKIPELAIGSLVNDQNRNYSSLNAEETAQALFLSSWLEGYDPKDIPEEGFQLVNGWLDTMRDYGDYHLEAQTRLDDTHGSTNYINHAMEYMVPHSEIQVDHPDPDSLDWSHDNPEDYGFDPETADNRYYNAYENAHQDHRDNLEQEESDYYYGHCYEMLSYMNWLSQLFPFKKGSPPPHPSALPAMKQMPEGKERWEQQPVNFDPEGRWTQTPQAVASWTKVAEIDFNSIEIGDVVQTNMGPATVLQKAHTPIGWVFRCSTDYDNDIDFMEHEIIASRPLVTASAQEFHVGDRVLSPHNWTAEVIAVSPTPDEDGEITVKIKRDSDGFETSFVASVLQHISEMGQKVFDLGPKRDQPTDSRMLPWTRLEDSQWETIRKQPIRQGSWKRVAMEYKFQVGDTVKIIYHHDRRLTDYGVIEKLTPFNGKPGYSVRSKTKDKTIFHLEYELEPMNSVEVPDSPSEWTSDTPEQVEDMARNASAWTKTSSVYFKLEVDPDAVHHTVKLYSFDTGKVLGTMEVHPANDNPNPKRVYQGITPVYSGRWIAKTPRIFDYDYTHAESDPRLALTEYAKKTYADLEVADPSQHQGPGNIPTSWNTEDTPEQVEDMVKGGKACPVPGPNTRKKSKRYRNKRKREKELYYPSGKEGVGIEHGYRNQQEYETLQYALRSGPLGDFLKTAAVDPAFAEKKLQALIKQLAPQKWAKEPFDPRPLMDGDVVRNASSIITKGRWGQTYRELFDAFANEAGIPEDSELRRDLSTNQGPTLTFKPGNLWSLYMSDPWNPPHASFAGEEVFVEFGDGVEYKVPLTSEIKLHIGDGEWIHPLSNVSRWSKPPKIVKRGAEYSGDGAGLTNLQMVAKTLEELPPEAATIYPWIVEEIKSRRLDPSSTSKVNSLEYALPYVEWQRMYGNKDYQQGAFDPETDSLNQLKQWVDSLKRLGLDPETNTVDWGDSKPIWTDKKGNHIVDMTDEDEITRHGEVLNHCYASGEFKNHYMSGLQENGGGYRMYGIRDRSGRPLGTTVVGQRGVSSENPHGTEWVPLESRSGGKGGQQPLGEGGEHPASKILTDWFGQAQKHGIRVDRSEENYGTPYQHSEFGNEDREPEECEEYEYEYKDGDTYTINDVFDLISFKSEIDNGGGDFTASEDPFEYDEENCIQYYQSGATIDLNLDGSEIVEYVDDGTHEEEDVKDIALALGMLAIMNHHNPGSSYQYANTRLIEDTIAGLQPAIPEGQTQLDTSWAPVDPTADKSPRGILKHSLERIFNFINQNNVSADSYDLYPSSSEGSYHTMSRDLEASLGQYQDGDEVIYTDGKTYTVQHTDQHNMTLKPSDPNLASPTVPYGGIPTQPKYRVGDQLMYSTGYGQDAQTVPVTILELNRSYDGEWTYTVQLPDGGNNSWVPNYKLSPMETPVTATHIDVDSILQKYLGQGMRIFDAFKAAMQDLGESEEARIQLEKAVAQHMDIVNDVQGAEPIKDQPNMLAPTNRANPEGISYMTPPPAWRKQLEQMPNKYQGSWTTLHMR